MSEFLRTYLAHKLTEKKPFSDPAKLNNSIRSANIDLNPHQVDAAIFAFKSPLSRGAILADEVGLGKTIEAGLIIDQLYTEGRQNILILVPASLRTQWQDELSNRFNLPSTITDGSIVKKNPKGKNDRKSAKIWWNFYRFP
jgi:Superfamily II DNA/RNA helicases, SNF2 family